jgi:hypothetical protein
MKLNPREYLDLIKLRLGSKGRVSEFLVVVQCGCTPCAPSFMGVAFSQSTETPRSSPGVAVSS